MDYPLRTVAYALAAVTFALGALLPILGVVSEGGRFESAALFIGLALLAFGAWVGSVDDH